MQGVCGASQAKGWRLNFRCWYRIRRICFLSCRGVDYCTNLVDLCNERCKKKVLCDKISFLAEDMRDMQFESKSFDAISFLGSLIHIKCEEHLPIFTKVRVSECITYEYMAYVKHVVQYCGSCSRCSLQYRFRSLLQRILHFLINLFIGC
ncbi:uncharacterized protein LOC134177503 isoform X3 [Corticium candelabrum]|uniref:uncharacterized protein LOC134177503 isoform X3 n=1 Tax=Corticium candelabrum TaxID=121492 RepID=UPI002E26E29E|nr:uncharacterized protein LOC134177503 isoform X3 [Corticium candelabrum]